MPTTEQSILEAALNEDHEEMDSLISKLNHIERRELLQCLDRIKRALNK